MPTLTPNSAEPPVAQRRSRNSVVPASGAAISGDLDAPRQDLTRQAGGQQDVWLYDPWCFTPWYTAALALGLQRAGTSLRLVCPRYHREPGFFKQSGLVTDPGPLDLVSGLELKHAAIRQALRSAEYLVNTLALSRALSKGASRILHLQLCPLLAKGITTDLQLVAFAKSRGVRAVHTIHNLLPHAKEPQHFEAHARFYRSCDRLICHSEDVAVLLEEDFKIPPSRIDVIPHGPLFSDTGACDQEQSRKQLGINRGTFLFLWQGILSPYKGLDLLLDAWAVLLKSIASSAADRSMPPVQLLIAGTGPAAEVESVRSRVDALGLGSYVRLELRYILAAEIPCYYSAADVLLYPYRQITTSGALMTGLSYRKPIIASDLPLFRGLIGAEENGLLLPAYTSEALAHAMRRLYADAQLFDKLQVGAQSNRERQTQWDEIAKKTRQTYEAALRLPATTACA